MSPFRALNSKYENEQKGLKISNLKQSTGFLIQNKSGGKDAFREQKKETISTNFGASFDRRNGNILGEIYSPSKTKSPIKRRIDSPRKINKNSPNGQNHKYI